MYKMLVLPAVRMLGSVYDLVDGNEKTTVERSVRRWYRSFCTLPWTTPNDLVDLLLGNVRDILNGLHATTAYKSVCRSNRTLPDKDYLASFKVRSEIR